MLSAQADADKVKNHKTKNDCYEWHIQLTDNSTELDLVGMDITEKFYIGYSHIEKGDQKKGVYAIDKTTAKLLVIRKC